MIRFKPSLQTRLNASIAFMMLIIIAMGFAWSIHDARKSVHREAQAVVGLALALIDAALVVEAPKPAVIHRWAERMARLESTRHLKIIVTQSENGATRLAPVVPRSKPDGVPSWFRRAVFSSPISVIREIKLESEPSVFVHIDSYAEDETREAWEEIQVFLVLQGLLLIAIYLSVHFIAGRALRPVGTIIHGLKTMEEGDYDTRLPRFGLQELNQVSEGINHLSSTLKSARDENRSLTRHSLSIQEDERRSIAKEIHDEFGQNLTAIKMMSGMVRQDDKNSAKASQEIQRLCDRQFEVIRALMRRLRPMVLEDLGLKAAIAELQEHWQASSTDLEITLNCDAELEELKGESALQIYRMIQEALTNTLRHSGATRARIDIVLDRPGEILLRIMDNGRGLPEPEKIRGFGLLGMRERVASLKGQFRLIHRPCQGLEIRISLPAP